MNSKYQILNYCVRNCGENPQNTEYGEVHLNFFTKTWICIDILGRKYVERILKYKCRIFRYLVWNCGVYLPVLKFFVIWFSTPEVAKSIGKCNVTGKIRRYRYMDATLTHNEYFLPWGFLPTKDANQKNGTMTPEIAKIRGCFHMRVVPKLKGCFFLSKITKIAEIKFKK